MADKEVTNKVRTKRQNSAMHKYFEFVSKECNEHGIDVKVMVGNLRVDVTPSMIKDIFRAIGKEKFQKDSTALLDTKELNMCVEEFTRMLSNEGLFVSFPSFTNTEEYLKSYES